MLFLPTIVPFLAVSAIALASQLPSTWATAIHEKIYQDDECKDYSNFNCHHIASEGNCEGHTEDGDVIGDLFCRVSCGRCEAYENSIQTDQLCYSFGKQQIILNFWNRDPELEDWVGIYPDDVDVNGLGAPVAWYWLCGGNKRDKCKTEVGHVTFAWLPPGKYRALLARQRESKGHKGPFSSYAHSEPFEVVRGNSCAARRLEQANGQATLGLRGTSQSS